MGVDVGAGGEEGRDDVVVASVEGVCLEDGLDFVVEEDVEMFFLFGVTEEERHLGGFRSVRWHR